MLLTHFIWQTVLKPLSGTNATRVGGNRTMRIQGDGHQHNHLRRLACLLACYNGPAFTRLSLCRGSLGVVLGDLVDVAAWGIVPCVSKIDTLGEGGGRGAWGGWGGGVVLLVTTPD